MLIEQSKKQELLAARHSLSEAHEKTYRLFKASFRKGEL